MKPEYFAPREDVILQNEAPTDFYIIVTGAVELIMRRNGIEQVVGDLKTGDLCGEIGVLCYRPQPFTVRTKRLSQLLRLNRTSFLNTVQANIGDGTIIMNNFLQHLKDQRDPLTEAILTDAELLLSQGRMDVPLSLCFAVVRGDDVLLHQLLKRGLDPNESDSSGQTALHIAASKGCRECVLLLLDYGADPNKKDSEGNVPLWNAIVGKHDPIIKLLTENGATLSSGDIGHFACYAVENGSIDLLKDLIKYGGYITLPNSMGTTALHKAISEGSVEMVKFLIEQGADPNKPDVHGWTPMALADYQGNEEIKSVLQTFQKSAELPAVTYPHTRDVPYLKKYQSEPTIRPLTAKIPLHNVKESSISSPRMRRRASMYQNSLFGMMSSANRPTDGLYLSQPPSRHGSPRKCARVTISSIENGDDMGWLVMLPDSLQELLEIGGKKLGIQATKVFTKDGALIEDWDVIRDGDHLVLTGDENSLHKS